MIKCDKEGVPFVVQDVVYSSTHVYFITLFDGRSAILESNPIQHRYMPGAYPSEFTQDRHFYACNNFVEKALHIFFPTNKNMLGAQPKQSQE